MTSVVGTMLLKVSGSCLRILVRPTPKTIRIRLVSLRATTIWLMIAGIMIFTAWGSRTMFITCVLRIPMAYAASAWPRGTALTPARKTSASTAPL